ncbi:MAG: hypothetical protein JRJ74_14840 [Deltaproteobacteria bacterium]|nr:hypothetical protein [Deltaproteobacteria bacterium]MBW1968968.1 hypothetical protein [Deltaproteobacteria bacterium]
MVSGIKVYKVKDFVRTTQTGNIDLKRSKQLVRELVKVAGSHADHNILIDLRETTVSVSNIVDILEVAREFGSSVSSFKNKIANIVPDDHERMVIAHRFKACMDMQGFEWEIFTDYEGAIEWLSEIENVNQTPS